MANYVPQLISYNCYAKPYHQTWSRSLRLPISGGGQANKNHVTGILFDKTLSYGWAFWVKFDAADAVARQIIQLGVGGASGYGIIKQQVGGRDVIVLQEFKGYTNETYYYPVGFDVTKWHHIALTWYVYPPSTLRSFCYINGRWITSKYSSLTYANMTNYTDATLIIGNSWADHTAGGNLADVAFFSNFSRFNVTLYSDDVYRMMYRRIFNNPTAYWKCEETSGNILHDAMKQNDLTLYNNAAFVTNNPSW